MIQKSQSRPCPTSIAYSPERKKDGMREGKEGRRGQRLID